MPLEAGSTIGDYKILAPLGAGGMGRVYKVQNLISNRTEAIKVLLPDLTDVSGLAERFMHEIQVQASLHHPNITALHTALRLENQLIMVMELVEGETIESRLRSGPLPVMQCLDYANQILTALDYAHRRNVIHRDLKPANIMVGMDGVVKLMDFGLAIAGTNHRLTKTGSLMGSLFYMAPEQIKGEPPTPRSDIYSFGLTLYEMLTGVRAIQGDNEYTVMTAHLVSIPQAPVLINPAIPTELSEFVVKAIAKDPAARFQTAGVLKSALNKYAKSRTPQTVNIASTVIAPVAPIASKTPPASAAAPIKSGDRTPPHVSEALRQRLKEIVVKNDDGLLEDLRRCESLLRDHCGPYRREIAVLIGAMEERVPQELKTAWQAVMTPEAMRSRLVQRLQDNQGLAPHMADWAVGAWSYALGVGLRRESDRLDSEVISGPGSVNQRPGAVVVPIGVPVPAKPIQGKPTGDPNLSRNFAPQPRTNAPVLIQTPAPAPTPARNTGWSSGQKAGIAVAVIAVLAVAYLAITYLPSGGSKGAEPCPAGQIRLPNGNCQAASFAGVSGSLPIGTAIAVTLSETLNSDEVTVGQYVKGTIETPVLTGNAAVIPQGASAILQVKDVDQTGKQHGVARIDLALVELNVGGKSLAVESAPESVRGPSGASKNASTPNSGKKSGVFGAIGNGVECGIGHITGHGSGCGATGAPVPAKGRPRPAELGAGSILKFKLAQPLNVG